MVGEVLCKAFVLVEASRASPTGAGDVRIIFKAMEILMIPKNAPTTEFSILVFGTVI